MTNEPKVRYSDEALQEFKQIVDAKIAIAQEELAFTQQQIIELNESGFNQQVGDMYDGSSTHADLEFMQRMAARQIKYIEDLQKALLRIQNKTYGICIVTGELISKERLRVVPHATKSVDGKNIANANKPAPLMPDGGDSGDAFPTEEESRPPAKPTSDRVRLPNSKRAASSANEEWEGDADAPTEDANFQRRNDEEED